MKLNYVVEILSPENHLVSVSIRGQREPSVETLDFFLPSWSPGSYLMREYAKNILYIKAKDGKGNDLFINKIDKSTWRIDWKHFEFKSENLSFQIDYEVYCHELTVRTSHIDSTHAFLHGPSYLMGIVDYSIVNPEVLFKFTPAWSKLSTTLRDVSKKRDVFLYQAKDYDHLLDCPVEIGCQETTGFLVNKIPHHLCFTGLTYPTEKNVEKDIQKIVEVISELWGEIPYEEYLFLTHFSSNLYGGLEHRDSTALHFCSKNFSTENGYIDYLCLVSHEYFHTWNAKRIKPKDFESFDYRNENYTRMLWLVEGMTVFFDELCVFKAGLCSDEHYLKLTAKALNKYLKTKGRRYHSLEDSSFNTWIKLYRPDENSNNSSISYYLKGGLVFFVLNCLLVSKKYNIKNLLHELWRVYKENPKKGLTHRDFMQILEKVSSKEIVEKFDQMIVTTEEIDFEYYLSLIGLKIKYDEKEEIGIGATFNIKGDRVFVKEVERDSSAYKYGVNVGDEILAINNIRFERVDVNSFSKFFKKNKSYEFLVSRRGELLSLSVVPDVLSRSIEKIKIIDKNLFDKFILF